MTSKAISEFRNAQSLNVENTMFDLELLHPDHGWIPYTLNPDDADMTINNDDLRALIGSEYAEYVAPTQSELDNIAAHDARVERDLILANDVDPLVSNPLRWADLSEDKRLEWSKYRSDLLNVPQQSGFPSAINWPNKPA
jgi:hypothetical protein